MEESAKKKIMSLDQLVELALESAPDDLPWELTNLEPRQAYSMMAAHVLDMLDKDEAADKEIVMLTVMIRLLVENFFLNLLLNQDKK